MSPGKRRHSRMMRNFALLNCFLVAAPISMIVFAYVSDEMIENARELDTVYGSVHYSESNADVPWSVPVLYFLIPNAILLASMQRTRRDT